LLGTLAAKYEKLGGEVKWMGKPDKVMLLHIILVSS
jgi:ribonucleotide monophosphatase NagD (HAD superfamily)